MEKSADFEQTTPQSNLSLHCSVFSVQNRRQIRVSVRPSVTPGHIKINFCSFHSES